VRLVPHRREAHVEFGLWRFALLFAVLFVLVAMVWAFFVPFYNYLVVSGARIAFSLVEHPQITCVRAQRDRVAIYRNEEGVQEPVPFSGFSRYIYFGLVPLLALFFATPGLGKAPRLKRALIGTSLLFLCHVIYLVSSIELAYVFAGCRTVGPILYRILDWTQVLLRLLWEVSPILIWAFLTHEVWWKPSPSVNRNGI